MNKEKALKNQGLEFREDIYLMWGEQYCLWNIWKTKKGFSVET